MNIYAIGDLHLSNDDRVNKPMDIFGDRWHNHQVRIAEFWEENVNEEDIVIIAGDISWGIKLDEAMQDLQWINSLKGTKVLIRGNHDLWWTSITKLNSLFDNMIFLQNDSYVFDLDGKSYGICGSRGWICPGSDEFSQHDKKIYDRELLRLEASLVDAKRKGASNIIAALHYPPTNDRKEKSGFTELLTKYDVSECVYGHLHGTEIFGKGLKGSMNGVKYDLISCDSLMCKLKKLV